MMFSSSQFLTLRLPGVASRLRACHFRRWRRGELLDVCEVEAAFNGGNLLDGIFIAILSELLFLYILELVAHLIQLFLGHSLLPRGEDDGVFACGMIAVHEHE